MPGDSSQRPLNSQLSGTGVYIVVNHHGDKPILNSGRIKIEPGSDADVQILPSYTTTTQDAVSSFTPEERKCYTCSEVK